MAHNDDTCNKVLVIADRGTDHSHLEQLRAYSEVLGIRGTMVEYVLVDDVTYEAKTYGHPPHHGKSVLMHDFTSQLMPPQLMLSALTEGQPKKGERGYNGNAHGFQKPGKKGKIPKWRR